jgi:hypothetical protein
LPCSLMMLSSIYRPTCIHLTEEMPFLLRKCLSGSAKLDGIG